MLRCCSKDSRSKQTADSVVVSVVSSTQVTLDSGFRLLLFAGFISLL